MDFVDQALRIIGHGAGPDCARAAFAHVLFVEVDDGRCRLAPAVEVLYKVGLPCARLGLEVVDHAGVIRWSEEQRLPDAATTLRVGFEPFLPPDGTTVADVLGWRWDVVFHDAKGERARWHQRLARSARLDPEAELVPTELSDDDIIRMLRAAGRRQRGIDPDPLASR